MIMVVGGKLVIRDDSGQARVTMEKLGWLWAVGGTAFTMIKACKHKLLRSTISETICVPRGMGNNLLSKAEEGTSNAHAFSPSSASQ